MEHLHDRVGNLRANLRRWRLQLETRRAASGAHSHGQPHAERTPSAPLPDGVAAAFEGTGEEYLYRPGELLVPRDDSDELWRALHDRSERFEREEAAPGVVRYQLSADRDVPTLVAELRQGGVTRVAPNHVVVWPSHIQWAPAAGPPTPAAPLGDVPGPSTGGDGTTVGVVDTGAWDHPWFAGRVSFAPDAPEVPDADGDGQLDPEAGHGTFVAGVVLQQAPSARVVVRRAAGTGGVTDELAVAQAIAAMPPVDLLNLSAGTYTHGDRPPIAILEALEQLWREHPGTVVVAAAGNDATERPFWPAATKRVIAVAALAGGDPTAGAAAFSNRGWWVDACAPGVRRRSTFLEWDGMGRLNDRTRETFTGWARWSGTSFAAPFVTGSLAALVSSGGGDVTSAAYRLVFAPNIARLPGLGAVVTSAGL